jgi:hypothetical protein
MFVVVGRERPFIIWLDQRRAHRVPSIPAGGDWRSWLRA